MLSESDTRTGGRALRERAAVHAALGEPARLAIVDELAVSDRSPKELGELVGVSSSLLAHHLDVLEAAGLVTRGPSAGDARRKYVRLCQARLDGPSLRVRPLRGAMLFVCTHNSARSQLAAALWRARTGRPAASAGTRPALRVHRGAVAAARRAGLSLEDARPAGMGSVGATTQVVTVCDLVHEELEADPGWWHWSIPDPVPLGTPAAFDAVVAELDHRIGSVARLISERSER